jgi:DNA-binding protein H-NS
MALKTMSIEKLLDLKNRVEATLSSKVLEQRRTLQSELSKLTHFQPGKSASKVGRGGAAWGPVAPKYRNPGNPAETWAGRGLKARWLTAAIASGKKLEDFAIAAPTAKSGPAKAGKAARKKPRKAKKSSKK